MALTTKDVHTHLGMMLLQVWEQAKTIEELQQRVLELSPTPPAKKPDKK